MALEDLTGNNVFIGNLNKSWPEDTDYLDQADDHVRGIKNVLQNTFPNFGAALTSTPEQVDAVAKAGLPKRSRQVFATPGAATWTKPAGIRYVVIRMVGGGGGGGGVNATGAQQVAVAGGGGGGGYVEKLLDVSAIASLTLSIGAAGAGGLGWQNGFPGTSSQVGAPASLTAGGGGGGAAANPGEVKGPGAAGSATGGDLNAPGGVGAVGWYTSDANRVTGGKGGDSLLGVSGPQNNSNALIGADATGRGAGGGGAASAQGGPGYNGGSGAAGIIIFDEFG